MSDNENGSAQPIACLSDVDDISDIDVEDMVDKLHKTITSKPVYNERSIFNTTLNIVESDSVCESTKVGLNTYADRVAKDIQDWETFVAANVYRPSGTEPVATASYRPSEEQQAYLNQGPDLQNFLRGFGSLMHDGSIFMQEFEETQKLQGALNDCCQFHMHKTQRNIVAEHLAGICHNK